MTLRDHLFATGIRRLGGPRNGFRYRTARGGQVTAADRARIAALRIPAPWTAVRVAATTGEKVQAIGRDAKGRWQYLYRAAHATRRARTNFDRLIAFGEALPALRRTLARDLTRPGLPREKALACAVALLATCLLRSGTEAYAAENGSFGLATLRDHHVTVTGDRIRLVFRGKHGVRQRCEVIDRRLARIVAAMRGLPGDEAFQFVDDRGRVRDVGRKHLNAYIRAAMGGWFSARLFRTWGGTLRCAALLARAGTLAANGSGPQARRAILATAVRETAAHLGNTVAACRRSYVHPDVLGAFARGVTVSVVAARPAPRLAGIGPDLDRAESGLLGLLRAERTRRAR